MHYVDFDARWRAQPAGLCAPGNGRLGGLRRFDDDRIADADVAAFDHLGIDPAIGVAETALQRLRDLEIARGGFRIDVDGGAAHDAFHHFQP